MKRILTIEEARKMNSFYEYYDGDYKYENENGVCYKFDKDGNPIK